MNEPPGWGTDKLSEFLLLAHSNTLATFANLKTEFNRLRDIDGAFRKLLENLHNLREPMEAAASFLCFRAHACFLGATRLSLAGQPYESAAVCRAGLESALYGLYVARTPGAATVWLNRSTDPQRMKAMFTAGAVLDFLESTDAKLGGPTRALYEALIEFGAHPNPTGVLGSAEMKRSPEGIELNTMYLCGDSLPLRLGIKFAAQTGLGSLGIACLIYSSRAEILGVRDELGHLAAGL